MRRDYLLFLADLKLHLWIEVSKSLLFIEYGNEKLCYQYYQSRTVAYLGFQKGGANFRWPLVLTQRGGQTKFSIFLLCQKHFFLAKGGPWSNGPL